MPLPIPNLDDRRFQDIVDEAKRLIPRYCPEWTDHNVSDPGVTLIELFAWMTELLIYRLNLVPDKSYITFMELMGVRLHPPAAARTALTFWLSAPPTEPVTIPASTEATTVQTSIEQTVSFATDAELVLRPPKLRACLTSPDERRFEEQTWKLAVASESFLAFSAKPTPGDALYLCYEEDLSAHILGLMIRCTTEGIGVDPSNPPIVWEAWCAEGWRAAELERDETGGLNKHGQVVLHLPPDMARLEITKQRGYWVRCRHTPPVLRQPTYSASPHIHTVQSTTLGGTVAATHATTIAGEVLGRSNGTPYQAFRLEYAPVLPRRDGETLDVQAADGSWEAWSERDHWGDSRPSDRHFVLDSVSGEVRLGPSIREPDGSERQYGAIPARDRQLRFRRYRTGGGAIGNVGVGTLTVLRSSVPYVDRVTNRRAAVAGRDAESLEHAKFRAPQMLRTSFRAVTVEDYEYLAAEASPGIARARCLQPGTVGTTNTPPPGTVQVLLVPTVAHAEGRIPADQLSPPPEVLQEVQRYLDERRLLTTVVQLAQPEYRWVRVQARIKARPEADRDAVQREALARLFRLLNPLVGGSAGTGWSFGRDLYISEVYAVLQATPGVEYIEGIDLLLDGTPGTHARIGVAPNSLIASAEHQVVVV